MSECKESMIERLRTLFSAAPCAVGVFDAPTGECLYANDVYYELLGYTQEEYARLIGADYSRLVYKADADMVSRSEADFDAGGVSRSEYRIVRKDGLRREGMAKPMIVGGAGGGSTLARSPPLASVLA